MLRKSLELLKKKAESLAHETKPINVKTKKAKIYRANIVPSSKQPKNVPATPVASSPLKDLPNMSEETYNANLEIIRQLSLRGCRALAILIVGLCVLYYVKPKTCPKQCKLKEKCKGANTSDSNGFMEKAENASAKYLQEMSEAGWPVDDKDLESVKSTSVSIR